MISYNNITKNLNNYQLDITFYINLYTSINNIYIEYLM